MNQAHDFKRQAELETVQVTEVRLGSASAPSRLGRIAYYAEPLEGESVRKAVADGCKLDETGALAAVTGSETTVHPIQGWDAARPSDLTLGHPELARTALELACFLEAEENDPNKHRFAAEWERLSGVPAGVLRFEELGDRDVRTGRYSFGLNVFVGNVYLLGASGRSLSEAYDECLRLLRPRISLR